MNIVDSSKASGDYAPDTSASASLNALPDKWGFRPRLVPTLAAALLIPLFLAAGQWQWNKALLKDQLQSRLDALSSAAPVQITAAPVDSDSIQYRKVTVQGRYEPKNQILIENRLHEGRAGFHVLTPLKIDGLDTYVLVNRGWVPALPEHHLVPAIETPSGVLEVSGIASIPSSRFFTLGNPKDTRQTGWQTVWANTDMQRYREAVDFAVHPFVIQLDAQSGAGGFVRDWVRPDNKRQTNLGYAFQWWGFAATTFLLWLYFTFRKAG